MIYFKDGEGGGCGCPGGGDCPGGGCPPKDT